MFYEILTWKFVNQSWFDAISRFASARLDAISSRLIESFRFVELHPDNRNVFSYEYASILRDSGSAIGSVLDAMVQHSKSSTNTRYNISHYREFLRTEITDIHLASANVKTLYPKGTLVPFEAFKDARGTPDWWNAYNKVKHSEHDDFRFVNLENSVNAVAALSLLSVAMGAYTWGESIFNQVDLIYSETSQEMSPEYRMFP